MKFNKAPPMTQSAALCFEFEYLVMVFPGN